MTIVSGDKIVRCRESMHWAERQVDGLKLAQPCKRSHLSAACLHAALEHGFAIVILVDAELHGSALALVRLQFEAYVRGLWLARCASDAELDDAGRDRFPKIAPMISALETPGVLDRATLSAIKSDAWEPLNSLTHTGYQQIGSRLSEKGVGSYFEDEQIELALRWAESLVILCVGAFAELADNRNLGLAALERARIVTS